MSSFFKAENIRLKKQIEELQEKILQISGLNKLIGLEELASNIDSILTGAQGDLKIVASGIHSDYASMIQGLAGKGVKVRVVTNDRKLQDEKYLKGFDALKNTENVDVVTVQEVHVLILLGPDFALLSGGPLDKNRLMAGKSVGLITSEKGNVVRLEEHFRLLLPSFMR